MANGWGRLYKYKMGYAEAEGPRFNSAGPQHWRLRCSRADVRWWTALSQTDRRKTKGVVISEIQGTRSNNTRQSHQRDRPRTRHRSRHPSKSGRASATQSTTVVGRSNLGEKNPSQTGRIDDVFCQGPDPSNEMAGFRNVANRPWIHHVRPHTPHTERAGFWRGVVGCARVRCVLYAIVGFPLRAVYGRWLVPRAR